MIRIDNYSTRSFTGWVRGTTPQTLADCRNGEALQHNGATFAPGRELAIAGNYPAVRSLWVKKDGGFPAGVTDLELPASATETKVLPVLTGDVLERTGLPHINGREMHLVSAEHDGPAILCHFRLRIGMFVWDLEFPFIPTQGFACYTLEVTHSDVSQPTLFSDLQPTRLTFEAVGRPDFATGQVLQFKPLPSAPLRFGNDQPMAWEGVVYWPLIPDTDACANSLHMVWSPVHLFDEAHKASWPPFGKFTDLPPLYSGHQQWLRVKDTMRELPGTWAESPIGPALYSGRTGETDGHTNDGEEVGCTDTPRYLGPLVTAAMLRRKPFHYREPNGAPILLASHPGLKTWSGLPHPAWTSDMLGKASFPPNWDTPGNASPEDQQHFFMQTLCAAYRLSGLPILERAMYFAYVNIMTAARWDESARAVGWVSEAIALLHANCRDADMRQRLMERAGTRLQYLLSFCSRDATHPGYWHTVGNPSYIPVWEHSLAARGLCAYAETFGSQQAAQLAVQAALFCVRYGWQETVPGNFLSIDSLKYDAATGAVTDVHVLGNVYHRWMASASCVVLKYRDRDSRITAADVARARATYEQERRDALRLMQPVEWMIPFQPLS